MNELAKKSKVVDIVNHFKKTVSLLKEASRLVNEACQIPYAPTICNLDYLRDDCFRLKESFWRHVLNLSDIKRIMSISEYDKLEKEVYAGKDFTIENINAL
ncbi:MAG: hypothetical protein ACTSRG_26845 [Candidatus Helarchaeota archaeon]